MQLTKVCSLLLAAGCILAAEPELRVPEGAAKKAAIEKTAPAYPIAARQLKVAGRVEVEATVDESGSVSAVKVLSGNPLLTKPAVDAVKHWRFHPFEADGKKVSAIVSLSFEFGTR